MDELTQERLRRNEATFRDANERILVAAGSIGVGDQPVPFICECADVTCTKVLLLGLPDYAAVREHPRRFVQAPGHATEGEDVVERRDGFEVVEKRA